MALSLIFWAVLAAYIVHILDETLMGGGFVIPGLIAKSDFLIGLITGCVGGFFLSILPTRIMPRISRQK